jgi:hypothetical protein
MQIAYKLIFQNKLVDAVNVMKLENKEKESIVEDHYHVIERKKL